MDFLPTPLPGCHVIEPRVFADDRGCFFETYHAEKFRGAGLELPFVQDNHSHSRRNVVRGLHYQVRRPQGKLVRVVQGEIFDVAVDLRPTSPTLGQWFGIRLSAERRNQLYLPPGMAHGFCVLSETADVVYKCTDLYLPEDERTILWNDAELGIAWPLSGPPIVSARDARASSFRDAQR
ncbi:MAG: dTDP-4-dehydrorhamnose 3,5-epimerase [Planctomycetaceae bacterium]